MSNYNQSLIEDYRQTIERLQQECTEKTNAIIALGEHLKAKEQECEQIKEKYEALKLENQEGYEIVAELKHECEELKQELDLYKTWYRAKHGDVKDYLSRYHKALEEIERVVIPLANKNPVENCWSLLDTCEKCKGKKECGNQSPYTRAKQILDIINKVKDR